jgi:hypothetical protein
MQPPPDWFVIGSGKGDASLGWHRRLRYWWCYRPSEESGLTVRDMAVWSLMWSYRRQGRVILPKGVSAQTHMDPRTVKQALGRLTEVGLLQEQYPVAPPELMHLFRPRALADFRLSAQWALHKIPDEERRQRLEASLDRAGARMLAKGWGPRRIEKLVEAISQNFRGYPGAIQQRFLLDLGKFFERTQAEHEKNQAAGKFVMATTCSAYLLKLLPGEMAAIAKRFNKCPIKETFLDF